MNIGITGHQRLIDPTLWKWVVSEIETVLLEIDGSLIGLSSLAIGADQFFANAVLKHGGKLHVIVPFAEYELKFPEGEVRSRYLHLLRQAEFIETLEAKESDESGYFAAGRKVVEYSDIVVAVWNGQPAAGLGGTGDVVAFAIENNKKIVHINPETSEVVRIKF